MEQIDNKFILYPFELISGVYIGAFIFGEFKNNPDYIFIFLTMLTLLFSFLNIFYNNKDKNFAKIMLISSGILLLLYISKIL